MHDIAKFFTKTAVSAARSLLLSEVKGGVKSFLNNKRARTIQDVAQEMTNKLGYVTTSYTLHKTTQEIQYKSSAVLFHEWLTNSKFVTEKIVRDEESGYVYVDGALITNAKKLDLINRFVTATGIKTGAIAAHLEQALKLYDVSDFTSLRFKQHFAGWDATKPSVIDTAMTNCFSVNDELSNTLFRKWMIGTAKRIVNPGCLLDGCYTLVGPGMIGKTSFFRNLLPEPFATRCNEIYCNPKNPQKFVENILNKSICCFDELQVLDYAKSVETFKQILTTQAIDVRLAYRRDPTRFALRTGFCATTNKAKFITDPFLSRRLWAVALNAEQKLNFEWLFANRVAMWQEATYRALNGESYYLSADEHATLEQRNAQYLVV